MSESPDTTADLSAALAASGIGMPEAEAVAFLAGIAAAPDRGGAFPGLDLLEAVAPAARRQLRDLTAALARHFAEEVEKPAASGERLAALRTELARRGLHGFVVPLNDEYHGEYVPRRAQRLTWLTGFTGSAGMAVVLADRAAVFTDGRYTLQVAEQVDASLFSTHHSGEEPPADWLAANLRPGQRLGYDSWLHTIDGVARLAHACESAGASLVPVEDNPVDAVWIGQPPAPLSPVVPLPVEHAGETAGDKRSRIARAIRDAGAQAAVLTLPESIAWLLNIRGGDVPRTPLPLGFALLFADGRVNLFIDRRKLGPGLADHLGGAVEIFPPESFGAALDAQGGTDRPVLVDPATAPAWVFSRLSGAGARILRGNDPCLLPKACKNPVELAGSRNAHLRDGAAVSRFLAWLSQTAAGGELDEMAAAERLLAFRRENALFQDLSFDTISGAGPNGAIVHYRVTPRTNRRLEPGNLYLVDSGAQYLDGTTDITRTIAIGAPSDEMRENFTRVLKGHIALATCRFPAGTTGSQLDVLARHPLWQAGLDYDHGTGHGVGSYLSVHEGPQRISKVGNSIALRAGMIVSNEPGYYKAGAYGIRIENLVAVRPAEPPPGAERALLGFETLTRAPIDRSLVVTAMMSEPELAWLNAYHASVMADLAPLLNETERGWLAQATAPVT